MFTSILRKLKVNHLRLLLALALILGLIAITPVTWAQLPIRVESNQYEAQFRDHILFKLAVEGQVEIEEITLFYRVADQPAVNHASPQFEPDIRVEAEYTWDLSNGALPPGVQINYWWEIADQGGHTLETKPQSLLYTDDRYDWHTLSSERLALHWYRGGADFGQALFDKAIEALDTLSRDAGITVTRQVQVFIYGSHSDLLGAIAKGAKEWTGGQAFPDMGVVVIGVSPANLAWGKLAMAHELSHLVVHQMVDTPLGGLPCWLDEGLAMYAEGKLEPEYQRALGRAIKRDQLITLRSLSSSFPTDPDRARLCYAQSYSLVEFILEEYGQEKMAELIQVFAEGAYYDDALREVLGLDSQGLDSAWREWMGAGAVPQGGATPLPQRRQPIPANPVVWASAGLCCVGGLLLVVVGGLLAWLRLR